MKILLVQESDWLERGPHQQHQLMERLSLKGHEIRVIDYEIRWRAQGGKGIYTGRQVFNNISKIHQGAAVTVIRPSIIKVPLLDYASVIFTHSREIKRQIKEFSPDVVIGFGILNSYLAAKAVRRHAIPFIYYWIDVLHQLVPFKPVRYIAKMVETRALRQADRILVINEKLKDYVAKMGAPLEVTHVIRAGIDAEQFRPRDNGNSVRKKYGLKGDDIVLFFMGWLYNFSGLKEVAMALAKAKNDNLKLLIVGEGDAYDELQQIRQRYHLQDSVILTGKKPYQEIPDFIDASDVCLLPAYPAEKVMQDIVPIKIYEYMAMVKPVIATNLPGVMQEFGEDNGVVYISKPEDAVARAISLVRDGNLKEIGVRARSFVEKYSWDNITNQFEEIIEDTVRKKKNERIS